LHVQGYGDAADLLDAEVGDDELRTVGEHQGDLVPLPQAQRAQMVSQGAGRPVQFPIGDPLPAVDDGHPFRMFFGALSQHGSQIHDPHPPPHLSFSLNIPGEKISTQ
jgi:hypothetical protein